jgi:hypothetical protein
VTDPLDDDLGSLVIITGPEWHGREFGVSGPDSATCRRVPVLPRRSADESRYAAVFPALPAGPYVLWRDRTERLGTVVVAPATVTELEWWSPPPP